MNKAFEKLLEQFYWILRKKPELNKPGAIIERMDPESRKLLQDLKSDEISSEKIRRDDPWIGNDTTYDPQVKKLIDDFDKKILK